jgi:hypothetical protein
MEKMSMDGYYLSPNIDTTVPHFARPEVQQKMHACIPFGQSSG